jgi:hypothetical protein
LVGVDDMMPIIIWTRHFLLGKIGDSYSLEVGVTAHVHTVLLNFHRPSPKKGIFFTTHHIILGYSPEFQDFLNITPIAKFCIRYFTHTHRILVIF